MNLEQTVRKFKEHRYALDMGSGKLSRRWHTDREVIRKAKRIAKEDLKNNKNRLPKILVFDVEISPSVSYTFGRFKYNIAYDQIEKEPIMLTWAAKYLGQLDVFGDKLTPEEVNNEDDSRIVKSLWEKFNDADIVIAHYGNGFDLPILNARSVLNGLDPYSPVKSIDTKKVASSQFKFPSNKLDALCKYFGIEGKIETDFQLWIDCLKGDEKALDDMYVYNKQDVVALEEVYYKLRPWIKSHPNLAIYNDSEDSMCACCGSPNIEFNGKYYYAYTTKYKTYRCKDCGGLSRGRKSVLDKEKGKKLLNSIPGR